MTDIPFYTKVACTITKMLMHHQLLESFHLVDTGTVYNEKTCNVTLQLDTVHTFTDSTNLQDFQSVIWVKSIVPSFVYIVGCHLLPREVQNMGGHLN